MRSRMTWPTPEGQSLGLRARRQAWQARYGEPLVHRLRHRPDPPRRIAKVSAIRRSIPRASSGSLTAPTTAGSATTPTTASSSPSRSRPGKGNAGGNSLALHPDGTVWGTGGNKEARQLFPDKAEFKFYKSPNAHGKEMPGAYGLTVAGDGSVWYAEDEADNMIRIDPATGKVNSYKIPYQGHAFRAA